MTHKQIYYKRNRLQQLRGFYYAVRTGSISKAAAEMNLTQAAVTLQIQSLERDLGIELFIRNKQKIELTKNGKKLYTQSIHYVQGIDDLFESFTGFLDDTKLNNINLAANHACISYILPNYIKKFKDEHPNVKFQIRNLSKKECISRLLSNEIDMFIYPLDLDGIPSEFEFLPIVKYQPILLTQKNHPLAQKQNITLKDVADYELLRIDPNLITLPAFEELLKANKIRSNIEFEMSDWEILKKFVKAGVGVAMISNIILEGEAQDDLVERDLTHYFPEMNYGIFMRKGKGAEGMLKKFVTLLTTEKLLQGQK